MRIVLAPSRIALSLSIGCADGTPAPQPSSAPALTVSTLLAVTDGGGNAPVAAAPTASTHLTSRAIALPGRNGHLTLDFLIFEPAHGRVWAPVGDTGSVDVLDPASGQFARIDGFKNVEREAHGKKRMMGPSSGAFGNGFMYIGNRGSNEVCAIDVSTLKPGKCVKVATAPDAVAYVGSVKELWVTTPTDMSLTVLDASNPGALMPKSVIKTPRSPECYAVDDTHGLFFTNLEDKDQTLAIDVRDHKIKSSWPSGCGSDGPRESRSTQLTKLRWSRVRITSRFSMTGTALSSPRSTQGAASTTLIG